MLLLFTDKLDTCRELLYYWSIHFTMFDMIGQLSEWKITSYDPYNVLLIRHMFRVCCSSIGQFNFTMFDMIGQLK